MRFGLPYKGSKSGIAPFIVSNLPSAETFVDLFFGGGAVTHCAMLSRKYRRFVANDIVGDNIDLFLDAVAGKYRGYSRFVSREEFFREKDSDPFVRTIWSFGNNLRNYIYSRESEPAKHAMHNAIVLDDWDWLTDIHPVLAAIARKELDGIHDVNARRLAFSKAFNRYRKGNPRTDSDSCMIQLQSMQSLQRLKSLESLQSLQSLQGLERHSLDYREVPIPDNACVYADPPYAGTDKYLNDFNNEEFWEWCRTRDFPVYVSEYKAPPDFRAIAETEKCCTICATETNKVQERLFVHERF